MEAELKVTPSDLRATASEFQNIHSQMTSQIEQMKDLVKNTSSSWEGEAGNTFRNKFNELDDDMTRLKAMINEHVSDLQEMATRYEQAEQEAQQEGAGLRGNVIV
ncbi:MAG: WXG100 family type VII secretion target [Lachnospiraceae bacterium]|nr:WXG100 family type VII secretion target [Lachnospiraceae bacterium]